MGSTFSATSSKPPLMVGSTSGIACCCDCSLSLLCLKAVRAALNLVLSKISPGSLTPNSICCSLEKEIVLKLPMLCIAPAGFTPSSIHHGGKPPAPAARTHCGPNTLDNELTVKSSKSRLNLQSACIRLNCNDYNWRKNINCQV